MNFRSFIKGMMLFIPLILASCSDEESTTLENKCKIICSVDEFESANPSRTNANPNDFSSITWALGDVIGIFPLEGYQEPFEIPVNQVGKKSASFDGGYWDVKDGLQYNAYYPFDKRNFDSAEMKTRIPVTYIGQKQNGNSCDIGAFDYTYSDWNTATNGSISFDFHHIGAIGVFSLKYPATTTYTKMTLSVDEALIPLNGCYDLTANDVSMVPDENSLFTSIDLELANCSGVAGETGVFYMMLPPMDLSSAEVTLSLTSAAGTTCTYSIEKAMNVKKGKLYRRTGIPTESKIEGTVDGWIEEESIPYVTFTADAEQSLTISKAVDGLEYSVNGGEWSTLGNQTISFGGEKGQLRLRGINGYGTAKSYDYDSYATIKFSNNTPVACTGDIRTLVDYENYSTAETGNARFCRLFAWCTSLTSAPELPATTLAYGCYGGMFYGCTSLFNAPELPATTLADNSYTGMFSGCKSLVNAPALPATTLASECYRNMFNGCESLVNAPALPATTLAESCYYDMFSGCGSLVNAPALPATTLAESCYYNMFSGCESLVNAPALPATTLAESCYYDMFSGCKLLVNAPKLPATTLAESCYHDMFSYCESLVNAPELPATTLAKSCYSYMFSYCEKLDKVTMLATDVSASYCLYGWLKGVSSTGTFTKAASMTTLQEGADGIPTGWTVISK